MFLYSVHYLPRLNAPEYIKLIDKHIKDNEKTMDNYLFCEWLSLRDSMVAMSRAIHQLRAKVRFEWNEVEHNIHSIIKQKIDGKQDECYQNYLPNLKSALTNKLRHTRNSDVFFAALNLVANAFIALTSAAGIVILGFFSVAAAPLAAALLLAASFLAATLLLLSLNSAIVEGQFIAKSQINECTQGFHALQSFAPSTTKNVVTDEPPAYTSFTLAFHSIHQ
ncbi:MAG: hypothetical protein J0I93_10045 [Legionella sp.]|nr:hypothetical protein [Legionella sp.]